MVETMVPVTVVATVCLMVATLASEWACLKAVMSAPMLVAGSERLSESGLEEELDGTKEGVSDAF